MENLNSKKFFFYLLICSIALSALMGIWAILSGEFGDLQARILGTTLTIVGTSILGLACGAFLNSPHSRDSSLKFVPIAGISLSVLSALLTMWLIWVGKDENGDGTWKALDVSAMFAFSFAQLSLLSLAQIARRFRWAMVTAYAVVLALATIVSVNIIVESHSENFFIPRLIGVLAVTDAAITVMIPIFHRLSHTEYIDDAQEAISVDKIDAEIANLRAQISRLEKQREDFTNKEI